MPRKKTPFAATTSVAPHRSISQITELLVQSGARQISQEYDHAKHIVAIRFVIELAPGLPQLFALPIRVEAMRTVLKKWKYSTTYEDAERVAWRQLFWWAKAQLALVETGMVQASEVFLPYAQDSQGKTMFEAYLENKQKLLAGPTESAD